MNKGIYPLVSGGIAQEKRLDLITSNLANASTTGYKKDHSVLRSLQTPPVYPLDGFPLFVQASYRTAPPFFLSPGDMAYVDGRDSFTDFSSGTLRQTGNPLDLALEGDGFFVVQTREGVRYTRNGNFTLNAKRELALQNGDPVLGLNGPIRIEPGHLTVDSQGRVSVDGNEIGTLRVVDFPKPYRVAKVGSSLFAAVGEAPAKGVQVVQGGLEHSNVNPVSEMGLMIQVLRAYESYQKTIQALDEMESKAVNEVGKVA